MNFFNFSFNLETGNEHFKIHENSERIIIISHVMS